MNPNSSTVPYLTASEFLLRRDVRSVYQGCTDNDLDPYLNPGTNNARSSPAAMKAILEDPTTDQGMVLAELLGEASGMLESAIFRSQIYQLSDIQALLLQGGNSAKFLKRIVSSLTMYSVMTRRPGPEPPDTIKVAYEEATTALNDLSIGVRILAFEQTAAAGLPAGGQFNAGIYYANNFMTQHYTGLYGTRGINQRYGYGNNWGGAGGIMG